MYPSNGGAPRTDDQLFDLVVAGAHEAFGAEVVVTGGHDPQLGGGAGGAYYVIDTVPRQLALVGAAVARCVDAADVAALLLAAAVAPIADPVPGEFVSIVVEHKGEKHFLRGREASA
jgi:hypothetical protein